MYGATAKWLHHLSHNMVYLSVSCLMYYGLCPACGSRQVQQVLAPPQQLQSHTAPVDV